MGPQFPLVAMGGGGPVQIAAKETELRGPTLQAAQGARNEQMARTIDRVAARGQEAAAIDYSMALDQERAARAREDAAAQSQAERAEEMAQRQKDFDTSVKAMAKMSVDPDRFWASRSTGQKVAGLVSLFLGGVGGRGNGNSARDQLNMAIDRDIKAQEFAFKSAADTTNAKQTAFAMAMQKYNNIDAARAAARAAALDTVQAQINQQAALYKSVDASNRADMAIASLEDEKMQQVAQGILFTPARVVGGQRMFFDPRTGIAYNESQAREVAKDFQNYGFDMGKLGAKFEGDLTLESTKAAMARGEKTRSQQVQLPNGDVVTAPSDTEATTLRGLSSAVKNANQLIARAREIRQDPSWMVSPSKFKELKAIQSELVLAGKDRGGLGALSGPDMDLVHSMTGDLTSMSPGVDAQLGSFEKRTNAALRNRVSTIPDAPGTAKGEMPKSFTAHGKK